MKKSFTALAFIFASFLWLGYTFSATIVQLGDTVAAGWTDDGTETTTARNAVTPQIYGSTADNGDLLIDGTKSATKTTSNVIIQGTGGFAAIGTSDLDGTPAVGQLTVKGTTNDGTTYPLVLRDSDEANVFTVDSNGHLFAGTAPAANTVIGAKATTNDGSTFISVFVDSDDTLIYSLNSNGAIWTNEAYFTGDVSALTFTDRTPYYEGDALAALKAITGKDGEIDHSTLPEFARKTISRSQLVDVEELTAAQAFEDVTIEEDELEEIVTPIMDEKTGKQKADETGKLVTKTEMKPILLETKTVQKGFKLDGVEVVPNMVEEKVFKRVSKVVKRQRKDVRFDSETGKFHRQETQYIEEPGRNLGAMISILTVAVQQLTARIEGLEAK